MINALFEPILQCVSRYTATRVVIIIKPHRLPAVHRCGLFLQMSHIASVRLCVGHTGQMCKNGWSNSDTIWGRGTDSWGSKKPCNRWGQDQTNPLAPRVVTRWQCDLMPDYFAYLSLLYRWWSWYSVTRRRCWMRVELQRRESMTWQAALWAGRTTKRWEEEPY